MTPAKTKVKELPPAAAALLPEAPKSAAPSGPAPTGIQKAAILMVSLGKELSSQVLRQLSDYEVEQVSREVARLSSVPAGTAEAILHEFHHTYVARNYALEGGMEYARNMLTEAFGTE